MQVYRPAGLVTGYVDFDVGGIAQRRCGKVKLACESRRLKKALTSNGSKLVPEPDNRRSRAASLERGAL